MWKDLNSGPNTCLHSDYSYLTPQSPLCFWPSVCVCFACPLWVVSSLEAVLLLSATFHSTEWQGRKFFLRDTRASVTGEAQALTVLRARLWSAFHCSHIRKASRVLCALHFGHTVLFHTSKHFLLKKLTEQTREDIFHFLWWNIMLSNINTITQSLHMHLHYCSDCVLSNTPSQAGSPTVLLAIRI